MRYLCLFVFVVVLPAVPPVKAQTLVRGTIQDAVTGEPLAAATVQIEGTYRGTISNADGVYELQVTTLPATLIVRFIGYETARTTITAEDEGSFDFRLQPVSYQLGEVVVTDEDPALRIMREVIERKQQWRASLATYETEAYNRFTISNDTGIVSIMETFTAAFWDRERGMKETLKGQRETANLDIEEALPAALFVTNLYDDDIDVAGYTLLGVTHPQALRHYDFRLIGTRSRDDKVVYDIAVEPKNKLKSAFVGRVSVLDSAYALIDVELRPGEAFLFPPPIKRYEVTYRQQFSNFDGAYWLPVDFRADMVLEVSFGGLLAFPAFHIDQVSRFTDYSVNAPLPDSLYDEASYLSVDSSAVASDAVLDREGVAVPLSAAEQVAYAEIDSTRRLEEAFAPKGPLARFVRMNMEDDGNGGDGSNPQGGSAILDVFDVKPQLWYNRVDAFYGGAEVDVEVGPFLTLGAGGGWSSGLAGDDRWSYLGRVRLTFGPRDALFLEGGYEAQNARRYTSDLYNRFFNSVAVLLGGEDYYDYYRSVGLQVGAGYEFDRLDARLRLGYRDEEHTALEATTNYDVLGQGPLRVNPPIEEGTLRVVTASLVIGDDFSSFGITGRRRLALNIEYSTPDGLNSDFDYTRYSLVWDWRQNTFYQRRLLPNTLDLRLVAGASRGRLPVQRFLTADASLGFYRPFGALRTRTGYPYEGDEVVAFFWEHNFRTVPFEVLGLRSLARRGYNILVFGGHARTRWAGPVVSSTGNVYQLPSVSDGFHHEVGVSISGLFSLIRIDFAKRLDADGFTIGIAAARMF